MTYKSLMSLLLVGTFTSSLIGCANMGPSPMVYSQDQVQQAQTVQYGSIVSIQNVQVRGDNNQLLTLGGTALGGLAGQNIGRGNGSIAGAIVGAMVGGLAAEAAQEQGRTRPAVQLTVRLDGSGQLISVVQAPGVILNVGQRVQVLSGAGSTRIMPM